jgi:hypothetical protein
LLFELNMSGVKVDVSASFRVFSNTPKGISIRRCCWSIDTASNR